jgi:hypothetical protein
MLHPACRSASSGAWSSSHVDALCTVPRYQPDIPTLASHQNHTLVRLRNCSNCTSTMTPPLCNALLESLTTFGSSYTSRYTNNAVRNLQRKQLNLQVQHMHCPKKNCWNAITLRRHCWFLRMYLHQNVRPCAGCCTVCASGVPVDCFAHIRDRSWPAVLIAGDPG